MSSRTQRFAVLLLALAGIGLIAVIGLRRKIARKVDRVLTHFGVDVESKGAAASEEPGHISGGAPGTLQVHAHPAGPHPRILLTPERLARLTAQKDAGAPSWTKLLRQCSKTVQGDWASGYEGWDWGNGALDLALCARLTHNPAFEQGAFKAFKALLDDKLKVGDGLGGDKVVTHDEGYPIRTHGWLGAIAYDWLHDLPEMTPELKKKAVDRFVAWTSWFKQNGYNHDNPISNYYAGYFGAVAFGGIACEGDDPRCDALRQQTQTMWNQEIVPTYRAKLTGGDFPEGWQYGDNVGALFVLYADSERTAHPGAKALFDDLPWMRDSVTLRAFALRPDEMHTYDNGDWSHWPPPSSIHMLSALAFTLPQSEPAAHQAEFLARLGRASSEAPDEEWQWLEALSDDPTRTPEDPRKGQMSYLSAGTATLFARSSFAKNSLWVTLTSAPSLSDHQHLDAGHFELYRGADPIFIDGGSYGSYSSQSHNVVIVDDPLQSSNWETSKAHNDIIVYKKDQRVWSDTAHMERFEDGGGFVYGLASYDSAFNNKDWPQRHERAVSRAERELVFSRAPVNAAGPGTTGRVVIYDRFTLSDARFTTTFIVHGGPISPAITGPVARFTSGSSAAWLTTLLPKGATSSVADETHNKDSDDRPYFTNTPPNGVTSFRYEVAAPATPASTERRFLDAIVVGASQAASVPAPATLLEGTDVAGAVIDGEAYIFSATGPAAHAKAVAYRAPVTATHHIVVDLAPSAAYAVTTAADGDGCKVTLTPGAGKTASAKGVLELGLEGCNLH